MTIPSIAPLRSRVYSLGMGFKNKRGTNNICANITTKNIIKIWDQTEECKNFFSLGPGQRG